MKNPLAPVRSSALTFRNPWRAMAEIEKEFDRFLTGSPEVEGFDFAPVANLRETAKDFVLEMDIPGIKKEEVTISVEGNTITVSGERRSEKEEESSKGYCSESVYGTFMRSFALPQSIDESKIKAQYNDGVLKVNIPKNGKSQSKKIEIQ